MSIIKRGERTYLLRISLGKDSVTGKRLYHTETVHGTRKEAEARNRQLIGDFERGSLTRRSHQTLNEFLLEWSRSKKANVKARTHQDYQDLWNRYLKDGLGRLPLQKITPLKVQAVYNEMTERNLSPLTVRRLHTVLNQALRQAVRWKMLAFNPAADVELPSLRRKKVAKPMAVEQAHVFFAASLKHRLGAVFRLATETGMRPQEYTALEWPDIDWSSKEIRITKTMHFPKGGGWRLDHETKTEGSCRAIAVSDATLEDLKRHRAQQLQQRLFLGPDWKGADHEFVFTNNQGGPISPGVLNVAFKAILKAAGLPDCRVYDLRHSHATFMLRGGVAPKVASERLGHSTIALTLNTYTHLLPGMQEEAANKVSSLVRGVEPEGPFRKPHSNG